MWQLDFLYFYPCFCRRRYVQYKHFLEVKCMVNESSQLTFIEEFWLAYKLKSGQLKMYIWRKYCLQILVSREVWRFYPLKSIHSYMALGFVSPLFNFCLHCKCLSWYYYFMCGRFRCVLFKYCELYRVIYHSFVLLQYAEWDASNQGCSTVWYLFLFCVVAICGASVIIGQDCDMSSRVICVCCCLYLIYRWMRCINFFCNVGSVIKSFHLHAANEMSHSQTVAYLLCTSLVEVYFLALS